MSTARLDDKGVVTACPRCGQKNRLPYGKIGQNGTCGRCGASIPTPGEPIDVDTPSHFQALISQSILPVVVDFWAAWCGPCRAMAPELDKVAASNSGRYVVAKVDTEALQELGERFQIRSIPTMAVFRNGGEIGRTMGARPAVAIERFIHESLSPTAVR